MTEYELAPTNERDLRTKTLQYWLETPERKTFALAEGIIREKAPEWRPGMWGKDSKGSLGIIFRRVTDLGFIELNGDTCGPIVAGVRWLTPISPPLIFERPGPCPKCGSPHWKIHGGDDFSMQCESCGYGFTPVGTPAEAVAKWNGAAKTADEPAPAEQEKMAIACICGNNPTINFDERDGHYVACLICDAITPGMAAQDLAIRAWNAMQKAAKGDE